MTVLCEEVLRRKEFSAKTLRTTLQVKLSPHPPPPPGDQAGPTSQGPTRTSYHIMPCYIMIALEIKYRADTLRQNKNVNTGMQWEHVEHSVVFYY